MEKIIYRKTLDVHKNGVQFLLQGFETADNMSRVIEISLMASGDAIDFPLERMVAMMYVTTPGVTEPSINKCSIKCNKVIYEVLPITEEGITEMQLKLIESGPNGATSVLASPKFSVEVAESNTDEDGEAMKPTFTALEDAIAKAKTVYDERFLRMELSSDCIFRAYYADGTVYETDCLKILFHEGNSVLSESFAKGDTGVRAGEDTDNAKYYSNVARSESLKSKDIMENSETILEEVRLHGVYTAFSVDFESGEVVYVSPTFKFKLNTESGELEASGQNYTFNDDAGKFVEEWLIANGVVLTGLQTLADDIKALKKTTGWHTNEIAELQGRVTPIEKGGTGATTAKKAIVNLGIDKYQKPWSVENPLVSITNGTTSCICDTTYQNPIKEETMELYMINSGQIYLDYICKLWKNNTMTTEYADIKIYLNEEIVEEHDYKELANKHSGAADVASDHKTLLLTVNNGDIIKVVCRVKMLNAAYTDTRIKLNCEDFTILANVETPYTYLNFPVNTITVEDILNALTGGDN